jgi:hypothetical protein
MRVAAEQSSEVVNDAGSIVQLIVVETGDGAVDDVPGGVAAHFGCRKANRLQAIEDSGKALRPDPMKLDVLADRYIEQTAPMLIRKVSDGLQLLGSEVAARYSDSDHEEAIAGRPLGIEPVASKPAQDISGNRPGLVPRQPIKIRDGIRRPGTVWLLITGHN